MEKNLNWLMERFIAHKGFHNEEFPENSLGAFSNAIENNYAIELDIRLLKDGELAVFHDNELSRMTGEDGYITCLTREELVNYKLKNTEYTIPTLGEALELIAGQVPVLIDIKTNAYHAGAMEHKVLELMKEYKGDFAIISFNPITLEYFRKNAPDMARGLLSTKWTKELPDRPDTWLARFVTSKNILRKRAEPDFLAYNIDQLPNHQTKKFKKIPLLGWCVTSQEDYLEKVKYVDNIIFEGFKPKI